MTAALGPGPAAAIAVLLAATLDAVVGEPPTRWHPVAWFGSAVGGVDGDGPHARERGALAAAALPLVAGGAVAGAVWTVGLLLPAGTVVLAGLSLFTCLSLRMLATEAGAVVRLSREDPEAARERLPALAGRDPSLLSPAELRSAAVESAAENLADGLVAPLAAFALGATVSLPAAAGLAAWLKAVNTMDSMLGYRRKPAGWASARLDDAAMWLPARAAAGLLALAASDPGALARATDHVHVPDSPNSGWPMATLAAALDARLRKPGAYDLFPAMQLPDGATAARGVAVVTRAGALAFLIAAGLGWLVGGRLAPLDAAASAAGVMPWF